MSVSGAVFILLMVLGGNTSQSGLAVVKTEFSSFEKCEIARRHLETVMERGTPIKAMGCFAK